MIKTLVLMFYIIQTFGEPGCIITDSQLINKTCFLFDDYSLYAWNCSTGNLTVFNQLTNTSFNKKIKNAVINNIFIDCDNIIETSNGLRHQQISAFILAFVSVTTITLLSWVLYYYYKAPKKVVELNLRKRKREY